MNTYTITNGSPEVERGLSLEEAAIALLEHDGYEFQIRRASREGYKSLAEARERGWELWRTARSQNSYGGNGGYQRHAIFSLKVDEAEARADIFTQVVSCGHYEHGDTFVYTDEDYDRIEAEARADAEA